MPFAPKLRVAFEKACPRRHATVTLGDDGHLVITRRSLLVASVALGACGGSRSSRAATKSVVVRGSDTMIVLAQAWAEAYATQRSDVRLEVSGGGTGTGIAALENGTADLATASRPMTRAERARIEAARGSAVTETRVCLDAITIYVHPENPCPPLDVSTLARMYRRKVTRWAEVGGESRPIVLYSRENSSGTYAYFKEHVLAKADFAAEVQSLPGTSAVVHAVSRDRAGIGFAGVARARRARVLPLVNARGEVVTPTAEDAISGRYPLARPLFVYGTLDAPAEAAAFVAWLGSARARSLAVSAGFFDLPEGT